MIHYNSIIASFICSLWSLEAAHANASDVFIFWLAIAATLKDLIGKVDQLGIPWSLTQAVTKIFNTQYEEFFANDIYFTTFALDPCMCFDYSCVTDFKTLYQAIPSLNMSKSSSLYKILLNQNQRSSYLWWTL
jgi:hypothetical protein